MSERFLIRFLVITTLAAAPASAQEKGTLNPPPLPALAHPGAPSTPANELFGRVAEPTRGPPEAVGFYSKGCLAGASELPINGPTWQVMRLSRNRYWGHPALIEFVERLSANAAKEGWPGLLIGDMAQPRGGPMLNGHASHQIGLDADIWLTPMPEHELTPLEREQTMATNVVAKDRRDVDGATWTAAHVALLKSAAEDPAVVRIFVNAAIKKALCRAAAAGDRDWLRKVRPMWGHDYHFHVRLSCPSDSPDCKPQLPPPPGDGCDHALDWWFRDSVLHVQVPERPVTPRRAMTLAALPPTCRGVLAAPVRQAGHFRTAP